MKYLTLIRILDEICKEAPDEYKSYKPIASDFEKLNQARSNSEKKKLYLIQSKFRTTESGFQEKSITADELVRMEIKRILEGKHTDSNGNKFNSKVKKFQKRWADVRDPANYEYVVVILGNLSRYSDAQVRRLVENSKYEIFDHKRSYDELVFPLCSGTCYDPEEITITINLLEKTEPILKQKIETRHGKYDVRILFVPTREIGRVLSKYKNSILQYNPRNYLSLSKNPVNRKIEESILDSKTNDFAILNNGITMIADSLKSTEATGRRNEGQVIITKPAIINGGQTAYVLSEIFDKAQTASEVFDNKEVLLKVVVVEEHNLASNRKFIQEISEATNQQTRVVEADRRSNDDTQVGLQRVIFDTFGYYYERKKGEFYNGRRSGYLKKDYVIHRVKFIKAYLALEGKPSEARSSTEDKLFETTRFKEILGAYRSKFQRMLFSYLLFNELNKQSRRRQNGKWGNGLRYGKMGIIAAVGVIGFTEHSNLKDIVGEVERKIKIVKRKWKGFESWAEKRRSNKQYIRQEGGLDFDNYYKGTTVNKDITEYFKRHKNKK